MKLAYDFHIHTALSPCADNELTPNNIINMALICNLDVIAITDHNSVDNCEACIEVAKDKELIVIPGMELQTKEEVHFICLFPKLDDAKQFNKFIKDYRFGFKNNISKFGHQYVYNVKDEVIKEETEALIFSVNIDMTMAYNLIKKCNGVMIPAHIDKKTNSIISNLGFIPPNLEFHSIGLSTNCSIMDIEKYDGQYNILINSDAHFLKDIAKEAYEITVDDKSIESVFRFLNGGQRGEL